MFVDVFRPRDESNLTRSSDSVKSPSLSVHPRNAPIEITTQIVFNAQMALWVIV
jgi:hypothetical protein